MLPIIAVLATNPKRQRGILHTLEASGEECPRSRFGLPGPQTAGYVEDMLKSQDADSSSRRPNVLRRLYAWVLHWAETPYGTPALFAISFAESSFFPIPPDVLQIALSMSKPRRAFYYAAVSAVASVLGGIVGWMIGYAFWTMLGQFFYDYVPGVTPENVDYVGGLYRDNAAWSIFAAAFTPIPFKVFTISAGVFHDYVSLQTLIIASALGRSTRFFMVAACIYLFGPRVQTLLERYLEAATFLLCILLVGGFLLIKQLAH
jgi:membrane protein YqaA with SNARE-associated domain